MTEHQLTLDHIINMTLDMGENWAVAHSRRLLALIQQIGEGLDYDPQIMALAAYMHDWGAFPRYIKKGVEHAIRSRQVVETEVLPFLDLTPRQKTVLLETIELHDYRDLRPTTSTEALLLREADMLEFLGMIGMARDLARGPRDVEICYRRILDRRYGIEGRFRLPCAQEIARARLARMETALGWLLEESLGSL